MHVVAQFVSPFSVSKLALCASNVAPPLPDRSHDSRTIHGRSRRPDEAAQVEIKLQFLETQIALDQLQSEGAATCQSACCAGCSC